MVTRVHHLRPTCDTAGCDRIDIAPVDHDGRTWLFCPPHMSEHHAIYSITHNGGRPLKPCGTQAAYGRHIKNGEVPCEDCYAAVREAVKRRTEARKAAKAKADAWDAMKDGAA